MKARWLIPLALGGALLWVTRPVHVPPMRLPTGNAPMPDWTMQDLDGRPVPASQFAGKVLVLNFWATWCPPCIAEIPDLQAFHRAQESNGAVVIGASVDEEGAAKVKPFVARNQIAYPVLLAGPAVQDLFGGVTGVPTTFIVDRTGRMVARFQGPMNGDDLAKAVQPLLSSRPSPGP